MLITQAKKFIQFTNNGLIIKWLKLIIFPSAYNHWIYALLDEFFPVRWWENSFLSSSTCLHLTQLLFISKTQENMGYDMFDRYNYVLIGPELWLLPVGFGRYHDGNCESIPGVFIIVIYSLQSCQWVIDKRLMWCGVMMQANSETLARS